MKTVCAFVVKFASLISAVKNSPHAIFGRDRNRQRSGESGLAARTANASVDADTKLNQPSSSTLHSNCSDCELRTIEADLDAGRLLSIEGVVAQAAITKTFQQATGEVLQAA